MWHPLLRSPRPSTYRTFTSGQTQRIFHDYFITHLPSSSLHPDATRSGGPHHKLPRDKASPHTPGATKSAPAAPPPMAGPSREMAVVRIPLKSAKHHFGVTMSRGQRPYNEDAYQAGVIEIPAFAKRRPVSLTRGRDQKDEVVAADGAGGDPQVFYFGLHDYVEDSARQFELRSSLQQQGAERSSMGEKTRPAARVEEAEADKRSLKEVNVRHITERKGPEYSIASTRWRSPLAQSDSVRKAEELERNLINSWRELVGGYFKRFKPDTSGIGIETVLTYAFLKADFDFVSAQVNKTDEDATQADRALNDADILGKPSHLNKPIGGPKRFKGGSTCSIALISTPTPTPFWNPSSPSTLITSHVGDTRILLCKTSNGLAIPLTSDHHPSLPTEATRLRRYAATFVTDSFGEERMSGLANTRAFGDMGSKRIGVSAEPEIRRIELSPAEYSFLVLVSDGISGPLSDQEVVDIVKEARTPEQGARDVVAFADMVATEGDNATALVVRLGGWERRSEGVWGVWGRRS
ncbi:Protein phosphatase 2C 6 [Coniosporium tulheliwenetii]|uniref:Protein phosphatase 2C 6 n=1 Tax=Coniosporium tulheliwenetii TaxID=3383036 RepID=A0ACC2YSD4_9PEZI|nr:Protein phosphatase 2C 6 [Cladosporium sp. JES 115]